MVKESKLVRVFKTGALTVCPVIFIEPSLSPLARALLIDHERVHLKQQLLFCIVGAVVGVFVWVVLGWPLEPSSAALAALGLIEGWVAGALLWRGLYLLVLPVGWNPFRRHWETQAYKTSPGLKPAEIDRILRDAPYYLWWM